MAINKQQDPIYFHRDYQNDFPSREEKQEGYSATRIAKVALPYISLYKPLGRVLALGLGGVRTATSLKDCIDAKDQKRFAIAVFHTSIAVISVAGTIFLHPLGMMITTVNDMGMNLYHICGAFAKGEMTEVGKQTLHVANNSLYLSMMLFGSVQLQLASLVIQVIVEGASSYEEFNKDNLLESIGHLGMCVIRANQSYGQWNSLQQNRAIESLSLPQPSQMRGTHIQPIYAQSSGSSTNQVVRQSAHLYGQYESIPWNSGPLPGVSIEEIHNFPETTHLTIWGADQHRILFTDQEMKEASFENLKRLPNLKSLTIDSRESGSDPTWFTKKQGPQITREQWDVIKSLPIEKLTLNLYDFKGIPLNELKEMANLKELHITLPRDNGIFPRDCLEDTFEQLNELSGVSLHITGVLPSMKTLNSLDAIENLTLNTPLDVEQLQYDVFLPNLKRLTIQGNELKGFRVDLLAPNLEFLDLTNSTVTGRTVQYMKNMTKLEEAYLGHIGNSSTHYLFVRGSLTSGAVKNLSKLPNLKRVSFEANNLNGADFSVFENHKDLEYLDLSGTDITSENLWTLRKLTQLKELRLSHLRTTTIGEAELRELAKALPNCKVIY